MNDEFRNYLRADIWPFGCVLYELLAGKRVFGGASVADTIAAVVTREPDWRALPEGTPANVRAVVRRFLQKDRTERLHDIGDARIELMEFPSVTPLAARPRSIGRMIATAVFARKDVCLATIDKLCE